MSYCYTEKFDEMPQFLASSVGLRQITRQIPQSMGVQYHDKLIVPAGTIFPANDSTAIGIVFDPIDVTHGDKAGSVLVGGHIITAALPAAPVTAAQTAMQANGYGGLTFEVGTGMVR